MNSRNILHLENALRPVLQQGNLAECEKALTDQLRALPPSPFNLVLECSFTNDMTQVARFFDEFIQREEQRFSIRAAYAEMNGFDINTDVWFFSAFAFDKYGGHDDYDWLSDWQSEDSEIFPLEGMESLQRVFAGEAFQDEKFSEAASVTSLLVVVKFQELVRRAARLMKHRRFPLLATAHDYDFIYEVS
ncbi:MAG TPA: hypothetical protein VK327_02610 [Candidatus Paceibacterota bacterium]|nr:hypothetical protein [Candidatus Paceibacterota bacterium]